MHAFETIAPVFAALRTNPFTATKDHCHRGHAAVRAALPDETTAQLAKIILENAWYLKVKKEPHFHKPSDLSFSHGYNTHWDRNAVFMYDSRASAQAAQGTHMYPQAVLDLEQCAKEYCVLLASDWERVTASHACEQETVCYERKNVGVQADVVLRIAAMLKNVIVRVDEFAKETEGKMLFIGKEDDLIQVLSFIKG